MADPIDLLTLDEAKTAINLSATNTDHDDEIAQQVTAVSAMIDAACGPVVQRTVTEVHDGGMSPLWLRQAPVASVTTIRLASGGTIDTLDAVAFGSTADGYAIDLTTGRLSRRSSGSTGSWPTDAQIEATYEAGRFADTASVDARFKECAASVLRRLWKREAGTWAQSAEFYERLGGGDETPIGTGFFRVAKPIIDEMLWDELVLPGVA